MQINNSFKGFPGHHMPLDISHIGLKKWNVLKGDFPLPLAVIKETAIAHNLLWMKDFCEKRHLDIAPHGKTTMSPELYARQLDAGAWGISFANVFQASLGIRHGVQRIIIANQVYQHADLEALSILLATYPEVRVYFLIDSVAQIDAIQKWQPRQQLTEFLHFQTNFLFHMLRPVVGPGP